jgi:hypothetical protein
LADGDAGREPVGGVVDPEVRGPDLRTWPRSDVKLQVAIVEFHLDLLGRSLFREGSG